MIRAVKIYNRIDRLRKAVRREGTPAIQDAWDQLEPHISILMKDLGDKEPIANVRSYE